MIFFIPNVIGDMFIKPAVAVIQPFLYTTPTQVDVHVLHGMVLQLNFL